MSITPKETQTKTGELTLSELESHFRALSLRELSFETAQLAAIVDIPTQGEQNELYAQLQQYLAEATETKVDGYVLFKEYLEAEIATWKTKKQSLVEMCDRLLAHKQSQLDALKRSLIVLHEQGLIPDYLIGKNKAIQILPNPKPTVTLLGQPEDSDFPDSYKRTEIRVVADKEAIAKSHLKGEDVSGCAEVTFGKQVRFKNAPMRRKNP